MSMSQGTFTSVEVLFDQATLAAVGRCLVPCLICLANPVGERLNVFGCVRQEDCIVAVGRL